MTTPDPYNSFSIEITADGCVADRHIVRLRNMRTQPYRVSACGVEKVKPLVELYDEQRGDVLACPLTGTLYDATTGRSSDFDLYLLPPLQPLQPLETETP